MRKGRVHQANQEMAYHALEILYSIVLSGETKKHVALKSTFANCRLFLEVTWIARTLNRRRNQDLFIKCLRRKLALIHPGLI